MIPNSLANNPYMNESVNEGQAMRRGSLGSYQPRRLANTVNTFYKPYTASTVDSMLEVELQKLGNINGELQVRCSQLVAECRFLEEENSNLRGQLGQYAQTLDKMCRLHAQQQVVIGQLRAHGLETGQYSESLGQRNLQLNNEIQNLAMDREMLAYRASEDDMRAHRQRELLAQRLNEKNEETMEMRRKYNGLLEAKARLEEQLSGVRFTLDNVRQQAQLELREKALKIEGSERTYHDALVAKNQEIRHLNDRLRSAEEQTRKLRENNTLLLTRGDLSQAPRLDNISRIGPGPGDSNIKSMAHPSAGKQNFHGQSNTRQDQRLAQLLSQKDRMLEQKDSQILGLQDKMRRIQSKVSEGSLEKRRPHEPDELQVLNPMIQTLETLRTGINKIVFEKFVVSANHADQRKQNSLVLFSGNMNEFVDRDGPQIKHSIDAYYEARQGLKDLLTKQVLPPALREKLTVAVGKLTKYENDFRDKVSKWVEGTLAFTIEQKRLDKAEKNRELLFLFRLLTIKYRILYPIRGKSFTVDADLKAVLEHKIVSSLRDYLTLKMHQ